MKTLQLGCVVAVMMGVVAGRCGESHGADSTRGAIGQDDAGPSHEAAAEEPAATPLTVNRTGPEPPPAIAPFDAEQARKHQESWALHLGLPVEGSNSIGMKFVLIPPGEFMMGSAESLEELAKAFPGSKREWFGNEQPQHRVRITRPFFLGMYEVTQEQYQAVMGDNPSPFKGAQHPVETVSWDDAVKFCAKLSELPEEKAAGITYRLPTEAEWEYACRAGTTTHFCFGDDASGLGDFAWHLANFGTRHPVGEKRPNNWGLYDMHGNVIEWCQDWYGDYRRGDVADPRGPAHGSARVFRGGGWYAPAAYCRSAFRVRIVPVFRRGLGFRVAAVRSGQ